LGKALEDADSCYYGIGVSDSSQMEADDKARLEFARNIRTEVTISSVYQMEENPEEAESRTYFLQNQQTVTDICLQGVQIKERYQEGSKFYSLLIYSKDEYNQLVKDEIQRELDLQKAKNLADETKFEEQIRHQEETEQLKMQEKESLLRQLQERIKFKEERMRAKMEMREKLLLIYGEFLKEKPPTRLVDLRNGETVANHIELSAGMGINPWSVEWSSITMGMWLLEFSAKCDFRDEEVSGQEGYVKVQLLPQKGVIYKTSLAFGYVEYSFDLPEENLEGFEPETSPLIAGNITLPNCLYTYFSFYIDARKYSLGLSNYALYEHFGNALSLFLEVDFIKDDDYSNKFGDKTLFQPGIRFQASSNLIGYFTYEEHYKFMFTLDWLL
jgi:hypothetical protein